MIYDNLQDARQACIDFWYELGQLQDKFNVYESCDDSCAMHYLVAEYYDGAGAIQTFTYDP